MTHFFNIILHLLEAAFVFLIYGVIRIIPFKIARASLGWLAKTFGPKLSPSERADSNLRLVFPEIETTQRQKIIRQMWQNLGFLIAELVHFNSMKDATLQQYLSLEENADVTAMLRDGKQAIFFTGHFANWEIMTRLAEMLDTKMTIVYRTANNPYVEKLIHYLRRNNRVTPLAKQSNRTARELIRSINQGQWIGLLADQKLNEGIAVPFLGHEAMTPTAIADLALKFDLPIVPVRAIRQADKGLKLVFEKAFYADNTGHRKNDIYTTTKTINEILEKWIVEYPEQWFWLHRRWPK